MQLLNAELDKSTNAVDAAGNLVKRYRQYYAVLTEPDEETVLQHYLSAVAMAYDPHSDYMSPRRRDSTWNEPFALRRRAVLQMDDGALVAE